MNALELLNQINFKRVFFKGTQYDKILVIDAIDHLAKFFMSNFCSPSPFVLMATYNHIKSLIAYYAILKAGKIPVILDPGCKSIELSEIIEDVEPAAIVFINSNSIRFRYDEEIIFRKQKSGFKINSNLEDVCTIAYTNAEDGYSKGAMLTGRNLFAAMDAFYKTTDQDKNSVLCALIPYSHLYGFMFGIFSPSQTGATSLITTIDLQKIKNILNDVQRYKVSHIYSIPAVYFLMSKVPDIKKLVKNVKCFVSGGTQLPQFIYENFYQVTDKKIREGYGLTECAPAVALNYGQGSPKANSFGRALPGCEIKIFDEKGNECLPEEIGEICVKGEMVFKGYFNNEKATNSVYKADWLHTGDMGKKDKDGFIYYKGLKKDMINVAGINVYPKRLERIMSINKNVKNVKVYGEDSVVQGQIVKVKIQLHNSSLESQDKYKEWCYANINHATLPKCWSFE